jgi:thiol-disulfide isomerase/thioredoxin
MKRFTLVFAALTLAVMAGARQTPDPKAAMAEMNKLRAELSTQMRTSGKLSLDEYRAKLRAKAEELTKGLDASKVEPKDALDWARVFQAGSMDKQCCEYAKRFLESKPADPEKFQAMSIMAQSCNALGEADMLAMTLMDIPVPDAASSRSLAYATTGQYVDTIYEKKGLQAALATLDTVAKKLVPEDPKEYAKRMLDAEKARTTGGMARVTDPNAKAKTDEEKLKDYELAGARANESVSFAFEEKKAELYKEAGKKKEAVEILTKAVAALSADSPNLRRAKSARLQMTLVASPAPAIVATQSHGEFKGLDSLKGKVVILDFFAHWCGPCIASFPDMEQMYADLHAKGLEVIGVTTYYGYYKSEKDLSREAEFAKMADFIAEHKLPWPVVYGERANMEAYGVTGIPTAVVIDRTGVVHTLHVGYSKESFKAFRAEIEKLLR